MRIDRLALAALALVASTVVIGCGSDIAPSNNGSNAPSVGNSVLVEDTTPAVASEPVGQPVSP